MKRIFQKKIVDQHAAFIGVTGLSIETRKFTVPYDPSCKERNFIVFGKLGEGRNVNHHV